MNTNLTNRQKADFAALPAILFGSVLNKKHYDATGSWWGIKGYGPIFRNNKLLTTVYLTALGVQLFYTFKSIREQLVLAQADTEDTLDQALRNNGLLTEMQRSYALVGVDDTTEITVCQDPGHGGDDVHMENGVCPMTYEHVTAWEKVLRDGKASNNGLQG